MKQEIIFTEHYALIVSDEIITVGDWFFNGEHVLQASRITDIIIDTEGQWSEIKTSKKVIAHRPLSDAPIFEGVPLLPEWGETEETIELNYYKELEDRREVARNFKGQVAGRHRDLFGNSEIHHMMRGFLEGYNKAKQNYKYTEEDIQKAFIAGEERIINKPNSSELDDFTNFIQSLQQAKRPKYFECEMEQLPSNESFGLDYGSFNLKPKTITNSQNQTELIGTYYYE